MDYSSTTVIILTALSTIALLSSNGGFTKVLVENNIEQLNTRKKTDLTLIYGDKEKDQIITKRKTGKAKAEGREADDWFTNDEDKENEVQGNTQNGLGYTDDFFNVDDNMNPSNCKVSQSGQFGSISPFTQNIQYEYEMVYDGQEGDGVIDEIIHEVETGVSNTLLSELSLCSTQKRQRTRRISKSYFRRNLKQAVIGLTSKPDDTYTVEECSSGVDSSQSNCVLVKGGVSLYMENALSQIQDESDILETIQRLMNNGGSLSKVHPSIVSMKYHGSTVSKGTTRTTYFTTSSKISDGYVFIMIAGSIVIAGLAGFAIVNWRKDIERRGVTNLPMFKWRNGEESSYDTDSDSESESDKNEHETSRNFRFWRQQEKSRNGETAAEMVTETEDYRSIAERWGFGRRKNETKNNDYTVDQTEQQEADGVSEMTSPKDGISEITSPHFGFAADEDEEDNDNDDECTAAYNYSCNNGCFKVY